MNEKPLISIVMPAFNRSGVIARAVESVMNQTFENWELTIVDDGSTDDTSLVLESFLKDKRITYRYQENKGASSARNTGTQISRGEYISFLDSDDEFAPTKLEVQLSAMKKYDASFSLCGSTEIIGSEEISRLKYKEPFLFDKFFFLNNKIPFSASFIMAERISLPLFNENLLSSEDLDIIMRFLIDKKILFVSDLLVKRYKVIDETRISVNPKAKINGLEGLIRSHEKNEYLLPLKVRHAKISEYILDLGFWQMMSNDFKKGRRSIFKGLKKNRDIKKAIIYIFMVGLSFVPALFRLSEKTGKYLWSKGVIHKK